MQPRVTLSRDELPLLHYEGGHGERHLVVVGPPGMSVRFWLPALRLLEERRRVLAFEYRGFPAAAPLPACALTFERCVDDLEQLLEREGARQADFVAWCAGTSLVLALEARRPKSIRSLVTIGVSLEPEAAPSKFLAAVHAIKAAFETDPGCLGRMVLRMQRLGLVRDDDYFEAIYRAGDGGPSAVLPELPPVALPATLGFALFDGAAGLENYLRLLDAFERNERQLRPIGGRVTLIQGTRVPCAAEAPARLRASSSGDFHEVWLPQDSEFLLLERAHAVAAHVLEHLESAERASSGVERPDSLPEEADGIRA